MVLYPQDYPVLLQHIPDYPRQLYYRGQLELLQYPAIAVVGSRALTHYGERACRHLVQGLVRAGVVIVSGLAIGIDGIAHRQALDSGGRTIAVLGSGLDPTVQFPVCHRPLAQAILAGGGLLLSEYVPLTEAKRYYFPERNRIIAGLTLGTVVVEAAKKSGALLTAGMALEYNRMVFAVPGSIFSSRSVGTHQLIQQGAVLADTATTMLTELGLSITALNQSDGSNQLLATTRLSPRQRRLVDYLLIESLTAEMLAQRLNSTAREVLVDLTELEIQGIVRKNREQFYEISHC